MYFVFNATDKPNHVQVRLNNRSAHLEHNTHSQKYGVTVLMGGPKIDAHGNMVGSTMILEAENQQIVENFLAQDPYTLADLFELTDLTQYKVVFKDGACLL